MRNVEIHFLYNTKFVATPTMKGQLFLNMKFIIQKWFFQSTRLVCRTLKSNIQECFFNPPNLFAEHSKVIFFTSFTRTSVKVRRPLIAALSLNLNWKHPWSYLTHTNSSRVYYILLDSPDLHLTWTWARQLHKSRLKHWFYSICSVTLNVQIFTSLAWQAKCVNKYPFS